MDEVEKYMKVNQSHISERQRKAKDEEEEREREQLELK